MKLLKRVFASVGRAARPRLRPRSRGAAARAAGAVGRVRTPTPPSICSGRSTCCPKIISGGRRSSTRRSADRSSWWSKPSSTTRTRPRSCRRMTQPRLLARPSAARPARAAGEARRACRRGQARAAFRPARFDRMETWAAAFILLGNQFQDMGLKGEEGVEAVAPQRLHQPGKAGRRA